MFFSTRNSSLRVSASQAIIQGLAPDGGLFFPVQIGKVEMKEDLLNKSYQELAFLILRLYLDDFSDEEIKYAISKAYSKENFEEVITKNTTFSSFSFLELFHGPTITFKDMALSLLPYEMEIAKKKNNIDKDIMILTATSGDTGSAALSNFSKAEGIKISVLYPDDGISDVQERQMLYFTSATSRAYSLKDSNFDDCQNIVKEILLEKQDKYILSSANSINVGRLLPQIVYYYYSYILLVKEGTIKLGDKVDVIVPTGNFGNILASYIAKLMGCPFDKIICASNENKVLTDFFNTGTYSIKREFKKTNSPSMDILISSNLERLLYLICQNDEEVKGYMVSLKEKGEFSVSPYIKEVLDKEFKAYSISQVQTSLGIKECFASHHYLIDPHTSCSYGALKEYEKEGLSSNHIIVVSTASPYKFPQTIISSLGLTSLNDEEKNIYMIEKETSIKVPSQLKKILKNVVPKYVLTKDEIRKKIFSSKKITIRVPCTSANLGSGFDVCGIALNLYNTFLFEPSNVDTVVNFKSLIVKNNLILKSYQYVFEKINKPYIPVKITSLSTEVPASRGLGSSATCIIAGILAASRMLNNILSDEEIIRFATEIEGHPDNVAPCYLGGFVSSYKENGKIKCIPYPVDKDLHFIACIPNKELSTKVAREVLPSSLPYQEIIYNLSHIIHLPKAFKDGDVALLKDILNDTIHTPYRINLIPDAPLIKKMCDEEGLPFTISGAGSTLLIISKDDDIIKKLIKQKYKVQYDFLSLRINENGPSIKEE